MRPIDISEMNFERLIAREWLTVNGIGGFASSTLCGLNTRKYHGLLVAAMSPPVRRMVLLSHLEETVITSRGEFALSSNEYPGVIYPQGFQLLRAFSAEPFPRWAYQGDGFTIEKGLRMLPGENTVCISYSLLAGEKSVELEIKPLLALRGIHERMYQWNSRLGAEIKSGNLVRIPASARTPEVFFAHDGEFRPEPNWYLNTIYRREDERGYGGLEDLWKPGSIRWTLSPGQTVHLACSVEPIELSRVCSDIERERDNFDKRTALPGPPKDTFLASLMKASEAFITRLAPSAAEAECEKSVKVIAQYQWSEPNTRAALIGFSGLFMIPAKFDDGKQLLTSLAAQMRGGLIPTIYPESGEGPIFSGADTSLWFINAVGEYFRHTGDDATTRSLFPAILNIISAYQHGTELGIACDDEGLIASRLPGTPTSWMDAKFGDWVITPRQGQTVELNALWYNALRVAAIMAGRFGKEMLESELNALAAKVYASFNARFWNSDRDCCFDLIDHGRVDGSVRPNQILAMSLPHAVLAAEHHKPALQRIIRDLLTPFGVRTLAPWDSAYQGRYWGNVEARDKAQHQGCAYPWLLGPLSTAYLKAHGRNDDSIREITDWLEPNLNYLKSEGVGFLPELFDGNEPQYAGGAPASALSVAEILRCYAEQVLGLTAAHPKTTPIPFPTGSALSGTAE